MRAALRILVAGVFIVGVFALVVWFWMIRMPGSTFKGEAPALSAAERDLSSDLERDVRKLAGQIGVRSLARPQKLKAVEEYIAEELEKVGLRVQRQIYQIDSKPVANVWTELPGKSKAKEIIVVGAHYDTAPGGTPGADDNASGVAGLLALGRSLAGKQFARTLRLVAFVNEEPPYFQTERMGSLVYAKKCQADGDQVVGMIALEMLGYYSDTTGSQKYPFPLSAFYPKTGDFIAFVGNTSSRWLVREALASFRQNASIPSQGAALPGFLPGIGFSDHWSFWQIGVPAIMVTDTAFFRNANYHEPTDTPDTLDYQRMARVLTGLEKVVSDLLK